MPKKDYPKIMSQEPIIIGAGVIGLSIGWHLTQLGFKPLVIDQGLAGQETSWAAAGMVTPASEIRFGEKHLTDFFLDALHAYPAFVSAIEKISGIKTDFQQNGSLLVAIDVDDEAELTRIYDYQKELGLDVSWLSEEQALLKEPLLSKGCHGFVNAPHECHIDNRKLTLALAKAFEVGGGKLVESKKVEALHVENGRVKEITVGNETMAATCVVLATGTRSNIKGLPEILSQILRPIKGQALCLRHGDTPTLKHAVRTIHRYPVYLVPRADGRLIIGASNEEKGWDALPTAGNMLDLIYGAWKVLPLAYEMEFVETWVGHRAATRDHSPVVGPTQI